MLPALKLLVKLYGRNYSVFSEKSKSSTLRFYASIESRYGGNRFTVIVRIRNGNLFVAPTIRRLSWQLMKGRDVFVSLTTRLGKSTYFQILPFVFDHKSVVHWWLAEHVVQKSLFLGLDR